MALYSVNQVSCNCFPDFHFCISLGYSWLLWLDAAKDRCTSASSSSLFLVMAAASLQIVPTVPSLVFSESLFPDCWLWCTLVILGPPPDTDTASFHSLPCLLHWTLPPTWEVGSAWLHGFPCQLQPVHASHCIRVLISDFALIIQIPFLYLIFPAPLAIM